MSSVPLPNSSLSTSDNTKKETNILKPASPFISIDEQFIANINHNQYHTNNSLNK